MGAARENGAAKVVRIDEGGRGGPRVVARGAQKSLVGGANG